MSATSSRSDWRLPGATASPTFSPWKVTVASAWTTAPTISPVDAFTPEGTSTEITGTPAERIASIDRAASSRGSPWKPVPKMASMTTSACGSGAPTSTTSAPSFAAAIRPSPPFAPLPQTATTRAAG
jgi:hypothetical protein